MTNLYYHSMPPDPGSSTLFSCLHLLPPGEREKIGKFHRPEDRYLSLAGKLLLLMGCRDFGLPITDLRAIEYAGNRRPFLNIPAAPGFNISHSGSLVGCVVSQDQQVGIDLEEIREIDFQDFHAQFTKSEFDEWMASDDRKIYFYNWWTKKEAILKAEGSGLFTDLKEVLLSEGQGQVGDKKWRLLQPTLRDNYICHVALPFLIDDLDDPSHIGILPNSPSLNIKQVTLGDFLDFLLPG